MANFDAQLQRMKSLMTYGAVNENKKQVNGSMEYHALGADGKAYGIIRENQKFYIKTADAKNEMVVEAYDYIGGFNNKKQYEYNMLSDAKKNFDMKLMVIKESHTPKANAPLSQFELKGEEMSVCGKGMMNEIARCRQIMNNAAAIMNESSAIGCGNTGNPEAPKTVNFNAKIGKPFEETATAELDKEFNKTASDPKKQGEPFGDGEKTEEPKDAEYVPSGSVANQKPKGGKVVKVDESTKKIWEMMAKLDPTFHINESYEEWGSEGLPSSEGVGSPEGHLMEDEEIAGIDDNATEFADGENEAAAPEGEEEMPEIEGDEEPAGEEAEGDEDFDWESFADDEVAYDEEGAEEGDDTEEAEGEEEAAEDMENPEESDEIADLRAQVEALTKRIEELEGGAPEGEEGDDLGFEEPDFDTTEVGGEEEFDGAGEFDGSEDAPEFPEGEEEMPAEGEEEVEETFDPEVDANYDDEEPNDFGLDEARKNMLEAHICKLVREFVNEDKLNVFGKHPGYRKKPMTLPPTGSDTGENGAKDWNDDSVKSEAPFGEKIGDSAPFTKDAAIQAVTEAIVSRIISGSKKKA